MDLRERGLTPGAGLSVQTPLPPFAARSKRVWELGFFKHPAANADKFIELQATEYVRYEGLPLETVDGQTRGVKFVSNVYLADGKRVIQCNIRDITERKQVETYWVLRQDILQSLNEPGEADDILPRSVEAGETVVVTKRSKPILRPLPVPPSGSDTCRMSDFEARQHDLFPEGTLPHPGAELIAEERERY